MEMCYDGTLVMPANYAVVSEDEMTYVDGGFALPTWAVGGVINLELSAICGGVSSFLAKAAKSQITAAVKRQIMDEMTEKMIAKGLAFKSASAITGLFGKLLTVCAAIMDPGMWIAEKWDSTDRESNNGWCEF